MWYDRLEEKWGRFIPKDHYRTNCPMPFISDDARLNVLFEKNGNDEIVSLFRGFFDAELPEELNDFYLNYNGCRLFFSSLNIFGIQKYTDEIFEPYDIRIENDRIFGKCKKLSSQYVFIGSLGGEYGFAFDKNEKEKIYCFEIGKKKIVKEYDSFNVFFNQMFDYLFDEYDSNGRKININKEYKGIPVLEHLTFKLP